ncbi:MAG: hypothetical protein HQL54_04825 [Magnetococcales bacterium]|nr:hypothetical protein [Magnetococcales bacterium]
MPDDVATNEALAEGEYKLSDPALLQNMRLSAHIKMPSGSDAILVPRYTLLTAQLIKQLAARGITTVFAESVQEKSIAKTADHMDKMFETIDAIVQNALGNIEDVGEQFQRQQDMQDLERMIRDNLDDIESLFSANATEKLVGLTQHHDSTARHSLISGFILMAIGRELGWDDNKIVKGALAALSHDVGKTKVKLETLDWPGRLSAQQWKEIQHHPLFGAILLHRRGQTPSLPMLTALLHHEWYASVAGKGYGGLTLHKDYILKNLKIDIAKVVSEVSPDHLDIIQASSLADMVSALEESRSYKRELDAFKVLVIMNSDAKMGHFNPRHYEAWHQVYMRQHPNLLPEGRRFALPREKEKRVFKPMRAKAIKPTPMLTYYDLEKLGYLSVLSNVGMDMERIRRRGGLTIRVLEQINKNKRINMDLSESACQAAGVAPIKNRVIQERQVLQLDAKRLWLTVEDLEKSGLMGHAKTRAFDIELIRKKGGISPARLQQRSVPINEEKLKRLNIHPLKQLTITLPGNEKRLTAEDLKKLGVTDSQLDQAGFLNHVRTVKSGIPMDWLIKKGINIPQANLSKCGIDPVRKIFYDIQVMEEIDETHARFMILREGDDLETLQKLNEAGRLTPIQDLLINQIGVVELDFTDLIALPDLSTVAQGAHWSV